MKKLAIIDLCLLQSIVKKKTASLHAKPVLWLFWIAFGLKRVLIGGLTDHKWVEHPVNAKTSGWITSGDYNQ